MARLSDEKWWPLVDKLTTRWETGRPLLQNIGLPPIVEINVKLSVDVEKWGVGFLSVREYDLPPDLPSAMREVTPQALLRDLHRPSTQFHFATEVKEGMYSPPMTETYRSIRAAQHRDKLPTIEPIASVVRESQQRRRAFLAERWQPHMSDDAPRAFIEVFRGSAPSDD